jgi:hypothetical protein
VPSAHADFLDQALYARPIAESPRLIHHRGGHYLSIRYTERLGAAGIDRRSAPPAIPTTTRSPSA